MSSIIEQIEKCIKRYDYLINKKITTKELTEDEEEELILLTPSVTRPLLMMAELANEAFDEMTKYKIIQKGGTTTTPEAAAATTTTATTPEEAAATATTATAPEEAAAAAAHHQQGGEELSLNDEVLDKIPGDTKEEKEKYIKMILSPLIVQLAAVLSEIESKKQKQEASAEGKKYKDVGAFAKAGVMAGVNAIKSMFSSESSASGILEQIDPRKQIPNFPKHAKEQKQVIEKLMQETRDPIEELKKIVAGDIKDIASSSIEGIMNALSLIPGVGTTLQLWRLLQNIITIFSKTTNAASVSKNKGIQIKGVLNKTAIDVKKGEFKPQPIQPQAQAQNAVVVGGGSAGPQAPQAPQESVMHGGRPQHKLWTTKKYKKEYDKSVKEFKRTRRRIMNYLKKRI